ncbi:MAG: hypothetical protein ACRD8Z_18715 [Nitrososphaeraceae archaeon]
MSIKRRNAGAIAMAALTYVVNRYILKKARRVTIPECNLIFVDP